ncbi:pectinesterase family protein, partial [Acetivibrio straminisolvens]
MKKSKKIFLLLCINLCLTVLLTNNIPLVSFSAVNADIIVAKDSTGNFKTIQEAIDSIPSNNSKKTVIFIKNGTYKEVVTIRKNNIHLIGESNTGTIITYDNYAGKLKPDGTTYGTSGSASFYLYGTDAILENLTIENSFDESINVNDKQAVAAYIRGDRQIIKNCIFIGNQDTLYAHSGRQYYVNCKIIGDTDFIFGGATAVFDKCEIISTPKGGYVTAASTDIENYGFLFLNCNLTSSAPKNSTYLGRPWRPNAYVVYKTCYLGDHIREVGWTSMSGNAPENARFFEYKNTGPGAAVNSSRRQLSDAEAAKFTPENILKGPDNWNPVG